MNNDLKFKISDFFYRYRVYISDEALERIVDKMTQEIRFIHQVDINDFDIIHFVLKNQANEFETTQSTQKRFPDGHSFDYKKYISECKSAKAPLNILVDNYLNLVSDEFSKMEYDDVSKKIISDVNYMSKGQLNSEEIVSNVKQGDICYFDFGKAYKYEAGYQHFGLVTAVQKNKLFVIPMTSNKKIYEKGMHGRDNLYPIPKQGDMTNDSVLFLNDAKWISSNRIIDTFAQIDSESELFKDICNRTINYIEYKMNIHHSIHSESDDELDM